MYAYLTFGNAVSILASRLQDPAQVYWSQPNELLNCLIESVRLYQALTGTYKQKIAFNTTGFNPYYHLPTLIGATNGDSVAYHVTDVEITNNVLAALLEPPLTLGWVGTGQFTFAQLQSALQNRLNRFIGETGCSVRQQLVSGPPPPVQIAALPDTVLDVRRVAWSIPSTGLTWDQATMQWQNANFTWDNNALFTAYPLGRSDEWAEQAYAPSGVQNPDLPLSYSVFGTGPLQLRLVPPPLNVGGLDCLLVLSGPQVNLNPAALVTLPISDDLTPALKWGVLADLLSSDGPSRDHARAQYCEQRYQEFVQIARIYPSVLTADVGNVTCGVGSVFDMDFYMPDWQQQIGAPLFVGMCGRNQACVGPVPDSSNYGIGLWMCANAAVSGFMQVNRDAIDPVIDYAHHIACFKMGGAEFDGTDRMYQNLIASAKAQNGRLEAVSFYKGQIEQSARKGELEVARMLV